MDVGNRKKFYLPSLEETRPTTLPPIMPPMQKMATTKDQMKVTEVSHAVFKDSHSSRLPLVACAKKGAQFLRFILYMGVFMWGEELHTSISALMVSLRTSGHTYDLVQFLISC